ncbi:hypothetical protein CLOP_g24707 [Closterium sp. NIES-67]|nr:hypothetical protein CLOP_g24707 [Closterium sp. NIES-67]
MSLLSSACECNLGETSKACEPKESGAAAKGGGNEEEKPKISKAAEAKEKGESLWGTIASAAFSNPTSATGECDWLTLHRRMGHVALPILQQIVKQEMRRRRCSKMMSVHRHFRLVLQVLLGTDQIYRNAMRASKSLQQRRKEGGKGRLSPPKETYMEQPEGYNDGSGRVWKLKKALYGLKQAPRQWYLGRARSKWTKH